MILRRTLLRLLGSTMLMIAMAIPALSQSLTCTTNASKVAVGSAFTVTYTASGKKIGNIGKPRFKNFEQIGSPSVSTQQSDYNGKVSMSRSYTYTVVARKKGKFKVPFVSVTIDGYGYTSNPVTVEVVEGTGVNKIPEDKRQVYITAELSDSVAYVGQMVQLIYTIYYQRRYSDIQLSKVDDFSDFFERKLEVNPSVDRRMIDGEEFYVREILKVGLTAQRVGTFDIDPAEFIVDLPKGNQRRSIFSRVKRNNKLLKAEGVTLEVESLPPGAPASFSGAVGDFEMKATIDKRSASTDDAFVVIMEISGDGELETYGAPTQPEIDGIENYDPKELGGNSPYARRSNIRRKRGGISFSKNFEYLLVPKRKGYYTIKPEFTYYDTDSNAYVTISDDSFRVQVSKGTNTVINNDRDLSVAQTLRPMREGGNEMSPFMSRFFDPLWWSVLSLGFLALVWMMIKKRAMIKEDNLDPAEKRRRQAMAKATKQLEKARAHQQAGEGRDFYQEISHTMNGFLGNKYGMANADFQKDKITSTLRSNDVSEDSVQEYLAILKQCEMALFAGQPSSQMDSLLQRCTELILALES